LDINKQRGRDILLEQVAPTANTPVTYRKKTAIMGSNNSYRIGVDVGGERRKSPTK
jgi:hypothetical protein